MFPGAVVGSDCSTAVLAVEENHPTGNQVSVYPNPVRDDLTVVADSVIRLVEIYDVQGRRVKVQAGNNSRNIKLNLEILHTGIYLSKISTENGVITKKVQKDR